MNNNYETVRESSMKELQEMYNYFSLKANVYDEYDRLERHVSTGGGGVPRGGKVWGVIITVTSAVLLFGSGIMESAGMAIISLITLAFGIVLIVANKKKRKRLQQTLAAEYHQMQLLAQELAEHYYAYGPCPLGLEYTSPARLEAIYEVIRQGRADTLREAVNILHEDAHRSELERLQRETAQAAWQTCAASRAQAGIAAANLAYQVNRDRNR